LIVDFHNHFYPKSYLDELMKNEGYARVVKERAGNVVIDYEGDYNIVVKPHVNIIDRLRRMDEGTIDFQVLTLTTPGVERESAAKGIKLARVANDGFQEIISEHKERFTAFAALPLQEPKAAVDELERAIKELGLRGGTLMSNVNGKSLDSEEFFPLYEKAVELDVPLFIHPTSPINHLAMEDFRLIPILGFGVDTSLAVLRLVFGGILERFPKIKFIASHLGGVYPYLRGRIDKGYHAYPECKAKISEAPSIYLKRIWLDSVVYDNDVLESTIAFSDADKIVLGTDEPHQIGDIKRAVDRIRLLNIDREDKDKILGGNAVKLLKLDIK
jgi:aminocarboxymuconate-semialdehyde decarboxylase